MASSSSIPITASSASASATSSSSSSSPCAACKFLRRKCQPDCVFAPYFPPDQPQKFVHVHRVFGASNVTKLLNELHPYQRQDAVNSLAYEADMRLRDPVYGCVGVISILQHQLRQLQIDLSCAKTELSKYQNAAAAAVGASTVSSIGGIAAASNSHFINVNHSGGMIGIGVGREQLFNTGNPNQHIMLRNYEGDLAARLGVNGSGYDAGILSTMNTTNATGIMPYTSQFMKPSAAGGDERPGVGPL